MRWGIIYTIVIHSEIFRSIKMAYNTKIQLNLLKYENNTFKRIAVIDDYNEISFSRKMYEAGEFTITINQNIPNAKLFEIGTFVQFGSDKYDIGEINNITTPIGAEGKGSQNLTITGHDLRYLFKRRVIKNCNANGKWEMTAKGEIVMRSLIQDQCGTNAEVKRRLPIGNVIPNSADAIGKEFSISESFSNLYDVLVTIATQSEAGWRIRFENGTMTLEFYEGEDLSASVFFSTEFDSLQDGEFNETTDAYSNTVYIGGKGQGDQRDIYEGEDGSPEGLGRFESWDDQSSLTNEIEYTNEALSMLAQYGDITTVQGTALAKNPYVYKENYNVGDIIKISFSGKSARTRVLSVTEHWSGRGQYAIDFEFGKPMNNLAGQLQLMLRQIQRAGDNSSSTDSVRWYTIPTDTEMPKADVTFNTIGFIGDCGNDGKTFKLYFDENGTGSKSYHVWFKQLAGGKLTLTTGVAGKQNLEMDSGTYVAIIYVDQEGNVLNQASAVSVNSGGQSVGTASTINVNGKTYDIDAKNIMNYPVLTLITPTGTAGRTYYTYTATKDCFFSVSQNWGGSTNTGGRICIYTDNNGSEGNIIEHISYAGYGTDATDASIKSTPTIMTHPVYLNAGETIGYKFLNYNGGAGMSPRFRIFTKD